MVANLLCILFFAFVLYVFVSWLVVSLSPFYKEWLRLKEFCHSDRHYTFAVILAPYIINTVRREREKNGKK